MQKALQDQHACNGKFQVKQPSFTLKRLIKLVISHQICRELAWRKLSKYIQSRCKGILDLLNHSYLWKSLDTWMLLPSLRQFRRLRSLKVHQYELQALFRSNRSFGTCSILLLNHVALPSRRCPSLQGLSRKPGGRNHCIVPVTFAWQHHFIRKPLSSICTSLCIKNP